MSASYEPGVYAKGDDQKVAQSRSDAVALVFDGYKPVKSEAPKAEEKVEAPAETPVRDEVPVPRPPRPETTEKKKD